MNGPFQPSQPPHAGPQRAASIPSSASSSTPAVADEDAVPDEAWRELHRRLPPEEYRPLSRGRLGQLAVAGVAMALLVAWALFERPGRPDFDRRMLPDDQPRCAQGQTAGCVGGLAQVIPLSPATVAVPGTAAGTAPVTSAPAPAPASAAGR